MEILQNVKICGIDAEGRVLRAVAGQISTEEALEINRNPKAALLPLIPKEDRKLIKRAILVMSTPTIIEEPKVDMRKKAIDSWIAATGDPILNATKGMK
jgi:hypothetical protein